MSTQVKRRRGTAAQCDAMIPADGEVVIDQTNLRQRIGDGTTLGGMPVPNATDALLRPFNNATVGGSANSITLTLSRPITSYTDFQNVRFKATATNTSSVTFNIDGVGSLTGKKVLDGSIQNLAAGDIVNGAIYNGSVNGGNFQVVGISESGLQSVSQGDLNTSTGSISGLDVASRSNALKFSIALGGGPDVPSPNTYSLSTVLGYSRSTVSPWTAWTRVANYTLPGGQYGFYPQASCFFDNPAGDNQSYLTATQRYITSSPPYDLGDGEVGGFLFALVNSDGEIVSHYLADAPPWAYNGPTDIRCTHKCPVTHKKFRKAIKKRTFEQIMDGARLEYEMQEITHDLKNKDMHLFPTPFDGYDPSLTAVLLDPMDVKIRNMVDFQNTGGAEEVVSAIRGGKFKVDAQMLKRKGPKGVKIHKLKYNHARKF